MAQPRRTSDEWLRGLRDRDDATLSDLRNYVRAALARGIGNRSDVRDADLEDFAQDATLRVLEQLETFRGQSRFTTWVTTIAIRTALSALRQRSWGHRSLDELDLDHPGGAPDPADTAARHDVFEILDQLIDTELTERQRTLIRAELAGMPSQRIAEEMQTNPNAIYKLYHDARKKLRQALAEAGFDAARVRSELEEASKTT